MLHFGGIVCHHKYHASKAVNLALLLSCSMFLCIHIKIKPTLKDTFVRKISAFVTFQCKMTLL